MAMTEMTDAAEALEHFNSFPSVGAFEAAMAAMDRMRDAYNAIREEWKMLSVGYIESNGDVTLGESRYYVGTTKSYKPRHTATVMLDTLLHAFGGDPGQIAECLSSDCWKTSSVRGMLDDPKAFDGLFETVEAIDLKTGKPRRELKKAQTEPQKEAL